MIRGLILTLCLASSAQAAVQRLPDGSIDQVWAEAHWSAHAPAPACILHRDQTPVTMTCGETTHTVQLDAWPLMVIDERERWGKPVTVGAEYTRREKLALLKRHLPGVIDDAERKQIAIYCVQSGIDAGQALAAIGCAGIRELNPIMSNPIGIIGLQLFGCLYARWDAKQTHQYNSSAGFIKGMNKAKAIVNVISLHNVAGAGCL